MSKFFLASMSLLLFPLAATFTFPQTVPSAAGGGRVSPYEAGGGYTQAFVSWEGSNRSLGGGRAWAHWSPSFIPQSLHGLGLEGEFGSVSNGVAPGENAITQLVTAGGGVSYAWDRFPAFQPYGKLMLIDGVIHFQIPSDPSYRSDSRVLYVPGGGLDCRVYGPIRVRAEYEFQPWPAFSMHAQDVTVGLAYDFSGVFRH